MTWLCLLVLSSGAYAITQEQVLKTAWEDKTYLSYDEIQSTDSWNPIRSVEGSVSQEKNTYTEAEVGLKFNFKSWPEWKSGTSKNSEQDLLRQSSLGWALKNRYSTLLFHELNRKKLESISDVIQLSEKYLKAQGLSLRSGGATAKSFLAAKTELYKFNRMQSALIQERGLLEKKIKLWSPEWKGSFMLPLNLISIEDIAQSLAVQPLGNDSLIKKIAKLEISQIGQELEIIKGREHQWIKGLEITHANKNDESRYRVELALQIPFLGSDDLSKQKQNELILKRALKQRDLEETGDQLQELKVQILNLIEIYKSAQKIGNIKIQTLDPLGNIERQIMEQKEKLEMLNQQQEITALYLDYLLESEILIKNPEKNYLDRELKAIL